MLSDTIFALATARAPAALAVFRISGDDTDRVISALTDAKLAGYRFAALRNLVDPLSGERIDEALIIRFEKGRSFTGEESAEVTIHGGLAVIDKLDDVLGRLGLRRAEPGEFSRRALLNGKLDLAQAESISALTSAQSDKQRRLALSVLAGSVGERAAEWRAAILEISALLETSIDFVDEELGEDIELDAKQKLSSLIVSLDEHAPADEDIAEGARDLSVAIIGPPNAGKSSLINVVTQKDTAIVSAISGTTRDRVSATVAIRGRRIELIDTAGIRDSEDEIERIGIERSYHSSDTADLRLFVFSEDSFSKLNASEEARLLALVHAGDVALWNKSDLGAPVPAIIQQAFSAVDVVSTKDGSARASVLHYLGRLAESKETPLTDIGDSARRRSHIRQAISRLEEGIADLEGQLPERAVSRLQSANKALEQLTAPMDHEDVLDVVFGKFCIGK